MMQCESDGAQFTGVQTWYGPAHRPIGYIAYHQHTGIDRLPYSLGIMAACLGQTFVEDCAGNQRLPKGTPRQLQQPCFG